MNESRRKLLQRGLMAALLMPSMLFTPIGLGETSIPVEQWYWYPGHTFCMKSTGKETGGTTTWMLAEAPPRGGVPFHKHLYEDESFYVIDGLFELSVGERSVSGGPGTYAYGPRNVPHRWTNVGSSRGRILNVCSPSGIEGYFLSVAIPIKNLEQPSINLSDFQARTAPAREKFGIIRTGPLKFPTS
jgi:quercetin dioxygenase-like cupin family protein